MTTLLARRVYFPAGYSVYDGQQLVATWDSLWNISSLAAVGDEQCQLKTIQPTDSENPTLVQELLVDDISVAKVTRSYMYAEVDWKGRHFKMRFKFLPLNNHIYCDSMRIGAVKKVGFFSADWTIEVHMDLPLYLKLLFFTLIVGRIERW